MLDLISWYGGNHLIMFLLLNNFLIMDQYHMKASQSYNYELVRRRLIGGLCLPLCNVATIFHVTRNLFHHKDV